MERDRKSEKRRIILSGLCVILFLSLVGCVSRYTFARVRQGKVMVDDSGKPEMDTSKHEEDAVKAIEDLMEAKGYETPDESAKDRALLRKGATVTGVLTLISLVAWYATKVRELGGLFAIFALSSLGCFGLGQIIHKAWIPVAIIILVALLAIGWKIKDKGLSDFFSKGGKVNGNR